MRLPSSTCRARTTVGRARYSPAACQRRRQIHQRDFCSFVRESNPPRPLAIETELPTRGSYERMCSDTVHEAHPSPPSGRRTIQIGAIRPAHADPLSLRSRAASRSGQCAFPSALTRQLRSHTTSSRFRVHVRSRLPAHRQRSLVHSLLPSAPQVTTRCLVAFERIHSR